MLNRKSTLTLVVLAMVLAIAAISFSLAFAGQATVLHVLDGCTVDNLDGEIVPMDGTPRGDGLIVVTENANGSWNAACSGSLPEGSRLPDRTVVWTVEDVGGGCGIPDWIWTTDFNEVITPSGQVTLTCHFPESPMPQGQAASFGRVQ
jgi:hypothetical protein